jgi:hypothetical protein
MRLQAVLFAVAIAVSASSAQAGDNNRMERVEIPGGVSGARLARLWIKAKEVCYANEYDTINEERSMNTIICKQDNMSMYLKFDATGFVIRVQSIFAKTPIVGGIFSSPRKHRRRMIEALLDVAQQA